VCGDGLAKTYKRVDNDLQQVSTDYTNQEGHKVLCHTWIPPPLETIEDDEIKEKDEEQKNSQIVKKQRKWKSGKEALVVDCGCVYVLDSGELLYVNKGEVGFSLATLNSLKFLYWCFHSLLV